ncbi:hypothetical protein CCAX7_60750 [Capsulimonas corticalis]|uniref:Uncharacterized protein n=1 Tax=Capsulimonas corticalis TaxID=2219043 RepID=A0A402CW37_9BACT|nr:DUF4202 domain-containing protein [Capsulimonas corticalis]BDI34024.1 hypothetical protein CCAX7_60750 [Capsulimonas corticalis]
MTDNERLTAAFERFDAVNAEDPNHDIVNGVEHPRELLYAQRMTRELDRFAPDASTALKLAARSQHIQRWASPRASYPMDRTGYLRWRTDLKKRHAELAGVILAEVGYDEATVARVQSLLRKESLTTDPEMKTLEDVICLVFLQHYFADFAAKHDDEKVIDIVQKTWKKMSDAGHEAALKLDLPPDALALVVRALGG